MGFIMGPEPENLNLVTWCLSTSHMRSSPSWRATPRSVPWTISVSISLSVSAVSPSSTITTSRIRSRSGRRVSPSVSTMSTTSRPTTRWAMTTPRLLPTLHTQILSRSILSRPIPLTHLNTTLSSKQLLDIEFRHRLQSMFLIDILYESISPTDHGTITEAWLIDDLSKLKFSKLFKRLFEITVSYVVTKPTNVQTIFFLVMLDFTGTFRWFLGISRWFLLVLLLYSLTDVLLSLDFDLSWLLSINLNNIWW